MTASNAAATAASNDSASTIASIGGCSQPVQNQEEEQQQGDYDMHGDMHDEVPEQTTKLNRLLQEVISSSDDDVYVAFGSEPLDFVLKVGGIYIQCNKSMLILSSDFLRGKIGDRSQLEVTTLCQPQSVVTLFEMALGDVEEPLALDINVFVEALCMCCQLEMKATTIRASDLHGY